MNANILIAGFGGQGILFAGKVLAYEGLVEGRQLSWLPSYGPEMRGGTCNCNVILSDDPVGSPIVSKPDILMVMNLPSLDKYEDTVVPGGWIFLDSTLIEREVRRTDVNVVRVPATELAGKIGLPTLANMVMLGKIIERTGVVNFDELDEALHHVVSAKRPQLMDMNKLALKTGYEYEG